MARAVRLRAAVRAAAAAGMAFVLVALPGTAVASTTSPTPNPSDVPQSLVATPAVGPVGTQTLVQLRGWPAGATVQVSTCGNDALNGNADCDNAGSISATIAADGTFTGTATFSKPPKPCPCVMHAFSAQSANVNNFPIQLTGYPTAPAVADNGTRALEVRAEVEGAGPLASWLGAAASRELVLTLTNTGSLPLDNPPTTVSLGRGQDPTELLVIPRLGAIAAGQTTEVRIPFELPAWSFGSYTVKTTIAGLDQPTAARASASTYPWLLLIVGWLLLQIPLLGLHKRRRTADEEPSGLLELDDPFRDLAAAGAVSSAAAGAAPATSPSGVPGWAVAATGLAAAAAGTAVLDRAAPAAPVGTAPRGATAPGATVDAAVPGWAAAAAAPSAPVTAGGAPSAVAAVAAAVAGAAVGAAALADRSAAPTVTTYGVGHLRTFVDPDAAPGSPTSIAARVVVGGVNPRH